MSDEELRAALDELRRFAEAHHGDEEPHVWLHGLTIDVPSRIDAILARLVATPPSPAPGLDLLPHFEVGQVVGDLQPGRRRHDWCSVHGDIGPAESIDAHARRAHGASSEAIRKARKTLRAVSRAARLTADPTDAATDEADQPGPFARAEPAPVDEAER